ncbi:gypsy type transposase, partial [Tanacetum coccineum]
MAKGTLDDGRVIAVKQLSIASLQDKSQFMVEFATISVVQHRNLVKLYGCCIDGEKLLVYEHLENKSLDEALFRKKKLSHRWSTRFEISLGVARGLTYLHEESCIRVIHRDVKASNVLLDSELNPKILNFGLAKLYDDKQTYMSTHVAGTIGYLVSEYAMHGHLTKKADVFGFGVVALKIISGRPNSDSSLDDDKIYLLEWNGWMSFSKRSNNAPVCYMKPLDSLKNWNDHFFWVDSFACPALFSWHTTKNVTRDPAPLAADFNAQDYATLVAHPSLFRKFPEEFLCLVGLSRDYTLDEETYPWFFHKNGEDIDLFAFIHTPDPTKVKVVEREQVKDEPLLLQITVGRTVPLLLVALDRAESEMEASVDKFFDEGGSGNQTEQGGSTGSGRGVDVQLVSEATDTVAEDVAPLEDHGTPSGPSVAGKSRFVQRLLAGAVLNANVRGEAISTLPFVTSSVSATPEREGEDHTNSVVRPNLQTINALQRFIISLDFSHHSGANVAEAEVDSLVRSSVLVMAAVTTVTSTVDPTLVVKEKPVKPSLFSADSSSA